MKLSEQIRPWDSLACCWDVKQIRPWDTQACCWDVKQIYPWDTLACCWDVKQIRPWDTQACCWDVKQICPWDTLACCWDVKQIRSRDTLACCWDVKQIRPWDTLACCWDVKQASNKHQCGNQWTQLRKKKKMKWRIKQWRKRSRRRRKEEEEKKMNKRRRRWRRNRIFYSSTCTSAAEHSSTHNLPHACTLMHKHTYLETIIEDVGEDAFIYCTEHYHLFHWGTHQKILFWKYSLWMGEGVQQGGLLCLTKYFVMKLDLCPISPWGNHVGWLGKNTNY